MKPKRDFTVNEVEQVQWEQTRKKGFVSHVVGYVALLFAANIGVYVLIYGILAIKELNWNAFAEGMQIIEWLTLPVHAVLTGLAAGIFSWYSKERTYKRQQSR